jgi:hypothetical protein
MPWIERLKGFKSKVDEKTALASKKQGTNNGMC